MRSTIERGQMMMWRLLLALVVCAAPLAAQRRPEIPGPRPSALRVRATASSVSTPRRIQKTYWKTGALITGIPGFLLGAGLANWETEGNREHFLGNVPRTIFFGLLLGAVTAIPGALIGGAIPKH